jgi:hypothetical protein
MSEERLVLSERGGVGVGSLLLRLLYQKACCWARRAWFCCGLSEGARWPGHM